MDATNKYQEPEWLKEAIRLYTEEHLSYNAIGKIFNTNRKTVSYHLRLNGVESNKKFYSPVNIEKLRKYDYSTADHIFDVIDTEEKAYWLGFLYADGYVSGAKNTIALALKEEDLKAIEKFRKFVGLENKPITTKIRHLSTGDKYSYQFSFDSKATKDRLAELGCINRKTAILKFPTEDQVPKKLLSHFIRGYIDGDGCIYTNKNKITVEILGTEEFLIELKKWINLGQSKIYKTHSPIVMKTLHSGKYALELLERIYKDSTIYLDRKYKKYLDYLARQEERH